MQRWNLTRPHVVVATLMAGLCGLTVSSSVPTGPVAAAVLPKRLVAPVGVPTATRYAPLYVAPINVAPAKTGVPRAASTPTAARAAASALAADGIPATALAAYQRAATQERSRHKACGLSWPLLAGIGRVESDHGRFAGAVLHTDGVSTPRIIGIPLDGHGTALIRDTDHGRLDGDRVYDRAVGPMQFIPSTWASYGVDANHDGVADPFNIFDAAQASADYLCAAGGDVTTLAGQTRAVLAYNHSTAYLELVLQLERTYARGVPGLTVPVLPPTGAPHTTPRPGIPPVDPGDPLAATPKPAPLPKPKPSPSPTPTPTATPTATPTNSPTPMPSDTSTPPGTATSTPAPIVTGTATPSIGPS